MKDREKQIKKYGLNIILEDERIWKKRGYCINYKTGLLEKLKVNNK